MDWTDNDTALFKKTLLGYSNMDLRWAYRGQYWDKQFWNSVTGDYNDAVRESNKNKQNTNLFGHTIEQVIIKASEFEAEFFSARESNGFNTEMDPLFSNCFTNKTINSQTQSQSMSSGTLKWSRSDTSETGATSSTGSKGSKVAKFLNAARRQNLITPLQYHSLLINEKLLQGAWPDMLVDPQYSQEFLVSRMLELLEHQ
ncbi:hypothetical protein RND81_13G165400 [Saponaria officinalis]|uniref:Uncharacterized protein n=1 Tax=Saponaria officinalis TaxID=3572 RepID=A0AAW1H0R4_SAPOF